MWLYNGKELTESDIPEDAIGFIYIIKHKTQNKKYLGRKLLSAAATRTVKGKKIKYRKKSDWETYWGSSPTLKEMIEADGIDNFTREILCFTFSKAETNYLEESLQYKLDILLDDSWINNNIRSKVFRRNVLKYKCHATASELVKRFS